MRYIRPDLINPNVALQRAVEEKGRGTRGPSTGIMDAWEAWAEGQVSDKRGAEHTWGSANKLSAAMAAHVQDSQIGGFGKAPRTVLRRPEPTGSGTGSPQREAKAAGPAANLDESYRKKQAEYQQARDRLFKPQA